MLWVNVLEENTHGHYPLASPEEGAKILGSNTGGWLRPGAVSGENVAHTSYLDCAPQDGEED